MSVLKQGICGILVAAIPCGLSFYLSGFISAGERAQVENILAYPRRITFPDDLPCSQIVEDRDGNVVVRFPISTYSIFHYKGWQEFLKRFGNSGEPIDMEWKPPLMAVVGGEFRAMRDGFEACNRRVVEASRTVQDADLRGLARKAYFPSEPPLPTSSSNGNSARIQFPTK
jgi:hypothetical protein